MDILSGFVAWLLMIFLQAAPTERLAVGDSYRYSLDSQNKIIVISVTGRKDKEGWVSLTAGVEEGKALDRPHHAVLTLGKNRRVTSFKEGSQELLTGPMAFGSLENQLYISTATDHVFKRSKQAPRALDIKSVAGYKGPLKIKSARYDESQDYIQIGTDPNLGLVYFSFTQANEISGLQLVEVRRPR